jgi:uncharacterized protein (DUF2252 family)
MGDLHVENFGSFDDDEGNIVFELNDFDESAPFINGNYLHDLFKLTTSIVLIGREMGFKVEDIELAVHETTKEYRKQVSTCVSISVFVTRYANALLCFAPGCVVRRRRRGPA